jgi:hypothetical protein
VRPQRPAEFGLDRQHRRRLAVAPAVEVPPAAAVADVVERPVAVPRRLCHGLGGPAGDLHRLASPARTEFRHLKRGRVPGHVRVVPLHPGELPAVRTQARVGDEVAARHQHRARIPAGQRHRDDLVALLAVLSPGGLGVVLAHAHQLLPVGMQDAVGVTVALGREWLRRLARALPVQALVTVVREHDGAVRQHHVGSAAVFVDARADVEVVRGHDLRRAFGTARDQHLPPAFLRAALPPPGLAVRDLQVGHGDGGAGEVGGGDGRGPGAVGQCDRLSHRHGCGQQQAKERSPSGVSQVGNSSAVDRQHGRLCRQAEDGGSLPGPEIRGRAAWLPRWRSSFTSDSRASGGD